MSQRASHVGYLHGSTRYLGVLDRNHRNPSDKARNRGRHNTPLRTVPLGMVWCLPAASGAQMTRAELEARRLSAIPDLQGDVLSASGIAKRYGVSRVTVYRWQNAIIANGENGLKARRTPGRPPRMTPKQMNSAARLFRIGPGIVLNAATHRWTQRLFAKAIYQQIGIKFSDDHVGRIMHRLGLVPTKART